MKVIFVVITCLMLKVASFESLKQPNRDAAYVNEDVDSTDTPQKSRLGSAKEDKPDPRSSPKERRVIFGADDRKKLPPGGKAQLKPHSSACKVTCRGFCTWSCSGVLIGSRHVLTSAHCVDSVTTGAVLVGFLERNGRFQWYNVMEVSIPSGWQASKAITDDYAVLKLRRSTNRPHLSVSYVPLSKKSVIAITGFPSDKPSNTLWTTKCRPLLVTNGLIWNQCDAARGSSGSGVLGGSPRTAVVGVLSGEKTIRNRQQKVVRLNVAVHLTRNIISQIKKWTKI
ncbi:serine protease 23-like [Acropora palmata]|uniref:serine protease 23-like n=1 Tax=Acropora palmata TaxID=6131 RepID=UPI003D9FD5F9